MEGLISKVTATTGCLLCAFAALKSTDGLVGTEAEGGSATGPMLNAAFIGAILFLPVLVAGFRYPRVAAAGALLASALCLPLYVYRTFPYFFFWVVGAGEMFVPLKTFEWHGWAATGVISAASVVCLYARCPPSRRGNRAPSN